MGFHFEIAAWKSGKSRKMVNRLVSCLSLFALALIASRPVYAVYQNGVDVYSGQGTINWTSTKNAGTVFAFTKATEGVGFTDSKFTTNMSAAKAAGVIIGPYHFARPDSFNTDPNDAANEANYFVDTIQSYYQGSSMTLRPVLDVEKLAGVGSTSQEKTFLSQWIRNFATVVHNRLGFDPILYVNSNFAKNYLETNINKYPLWLADWTFNVNTPPAASDSGIWSTWQFWQWTDSGTVSGISGSVDRDVFNGTTSDLNLYISGIPEPSTLAMAAFAIFGMLARRARRRPSL